MKNHSKCISALLVNIEYDSAVKHKFHLLGMGMELHVTLRIKTGGKKVIKMMATQVNMP